MGGGARAARDAVAQRALASDTVDVTVERALDTPDL